MGECFIINRNPIFSYHQQYLYIYIYTLLETNGFLHLKIDGLEDEISCPFWEFGLFSEAFAASWGVVNGLKRVAKLYKKQVICGNKPWLYLKAWRPSSFLWMSLPSTQRSHLVLIRHRNLWHCRCFNGCWAAVDFWFSPHAPTKTSFIKALWSDDYI